MPVRTHLTKDQRAALQGLSRTPAVVADRKTLAIPFAVEPWLFSGGARSRKSDPVQVVRPTSVLGQLRFFWRLLHPEATVKRLREREEKLFGWACVDAPFALEVEITSSGELLPQVPKMQEAGGYLMFSARPEDTGPGKPQGVPAAEIRTGVKGVIRIRPLRGPLDSEIEAALHAWFLLGGIGGRSRRGVGAVQALVGGPATVKELRDRLAQIPRRASPVKSGVRAIREIHVGERSFTSAAECMTHVEKWYRTYRQDRRTNEMGRPYGRSFWDEPELIRKETRQRLPRHAALPLPQGKHATGWARAVFGLPILTKFLGGGNSSHTEPCITTLRPAKRDFERMSSPLLFRSVRVGKQYHPIVVILSGPYAPPGGLALEVGKRLISVPMTTDVDRVFADLLEWSGNPLQLAKA